MTLQSRRKRRITAPNTPLATAKGVERRRAAAWARAGLLAGILGTLAATPPCGAEEHESRVAPLQLAQQAVFRDAPRRNAFRLVSHGEPAAEADATSATNETPRTAAGDGLRWAPPEQRPLPEQRVATWTARDESALSAPRAAPAPTASSSTASSSTASSSTASSANSASSAGNAASSANSSKFSSGGDPFADPFGDRRQVVRSEPRTPSSHSVSQPSNHSSQGVSRSFSREEVWGNGASSSPKNPGSFSGPASSGGVSSGGTGHGGTGYGARAIGATDVDGERSHSSSPPARRGSSFADDWKWSETGSSTSRGAGRSFRSTHAAQADAGDADEAGSAAKAAPVETHAATAGRDCRDTSCDRTLRLVSIRDITLDVTPRLAPGAEADEAEAEARAQRLEQAPSRQWRSPEGHLVVEGRLVDLRRGEALVESSDGRIVNLPIHQLGEDERCFVAAWWKLPIECSLGEERPMAPRMWTPSTFTWTASGLCHKPLYFQETQLERYGHAAHPLIQPVLSGAHFFASMATLPYQAGIHPPYECQYDLGYYRVGDCAPWLLPPAPISLRGGLLQAGVLTGGVFLFP